MDLGSSRAGKFSVANHPLRTMLVRLSQCSVMIIHFSMRQVLPVGFLHQGIGCLITAASSNRSLIGV